MGEHGEAEPAARHVRVETWGGPALGGFVAAGAIGRCALRAGVLIVGDRIRQPDGWRGRRFRFADGTSAAVYRETVLASPSPARPAVLLVAFRLRAVRGEVAHALFRYESLLNTVFFVGFPGFVSKLWLRHDEQGTYRGVYEWDGTALAISYVRALAWLLALVSVPGSVRAAVLPGLHVAELLADPAAVDTPPGGEERPWWRLVGVEVGVGAAAGAG